MAGSINDQSAGEDPASPQPTDRFVGAFIRKFQVPLTGVITAALTLAGVYVEGTFRASETQSVQVHEITLAELRYIQEFTSDLLDVDIAEEGARRAEQRRRLCLTARMGVFQFPDFVLGSSPADDDYYEKLLRFLEDNFQCSDFQGDDILPSTIPSVSSAVEPVSSPDIATAIDLLSSSDTAQRRQARRDLAGFGIEMVSPTVNAYIAESESYRVRLGALVALNTLITGNPGLRADISDRITQRELYALALSVDDFDSTIQQYGTSFLSQLSDQRIIEGVPELWSEITSRDGHYNLALVIRTTAARIGESDNNQLQSSIETVLDEASPRTRALLQEALDSLNGE